MDVPTTLEPIRLCWVNVERTEMWRACPPGIYRCRFPDQRLRSRLLLESESICTV